MSGSEIVICGAGIAGVALAYDLAVVHGWRGVTLVDERPPLSLTSDKSTECYRAWWPGPGPAMVQLMTRSIERLEALAERTGNLFHLNRRGYVYVTGQASRAAQMLAAARDISALGAGPVRLHPGPDPYQPADTKGWVGPDGADFFQDSEQIRRHFPYLPKNTAAVLHARRAGWFSAQQLGMYLLEQARAHGAQLIEGRVAGVEVESERVRAVSVEAGGQTQRLEAERFVNAAGPFLKPVGRLLGVDLPVFAERHLKLMFNDHLGAVPRQAGLLIWEDPQVLPWSDEERAALAESEETRWLLGPFPAGVHARPEGPAGSQVVIMLWDYHPAPAEIVFLPVLDPDFPEVALRGMSAMLPALRGYFDRPPRPVVDAGYYLKTRENRPLIGPLPVEGAYVLGALSGYGLMAALGASELLAAHITGGALPDWAPAFRLERYDDPDYQRQLENWGATGQL